jgi:hypothetical protein
MLIPAPSAAASPTKRAACDPARKAVAKIGARVETVPSIRPISAGWTRCSMKRSSSAGAIRPASLATNSAMRP